eukprot:g1244.t1
MICTAWEVSEWANAHQPGIRLMSHEVEKQLRMVPGSLFGLTADAKSWKEADSQQAERVNGNVNGKAATVAKDLRGRPMFLGEAKEILKAFKESLLCPAVVRSMQNIEQRGGVRMEQHRRVLITQEWNPIMKRFDFPTTEAGYEAMKVGIRQFAENDYVRSSSHEVERLCGAPAGSYFGIPTEEAWWDHPMGSPPTREELFGTLEEKRKAEEARKAEERRKAAEEERKKREEAKDAATKEELGPTPQPEISAPRDRHTIDSPAIPELPEPPNTLCFETSVQLPLFRATSATTEDVVGVAPLGARLRGTVEETNWLRLLPQSCRALGALAELVPAIGSDPVAVGHAGRFRVSAKQAAVRAHPELRGKVVGVVHVGRMLMGTPHKVAGHLWLRFEGSSWRKVADEEAWALIQDVCGASILEPLDADGQRALRSYQGKLPQTPVTDPVKVAQRMDAASLARKQLQGPLEYRVLAEDHSAPVRKEPLVQSPQVGKLERGELVYGYPGGGWLQLAECDLENSWVFIGQRLLACWGELRVTARTYDALEVTWPGLHQEKRVAYNVEWRTPEGAAKQMRGHKVSASNKVVVGNLPQGLLCLRVGARPRPIGGAMPPYRPPHMRNQPPMPKLTLVGRNEAILTTPTQTDTDGAPLTNMSEKLADMGSVNIQVTVQQATHEQMEKYIRSKGSEHFLGAELKLTTQGGEPLTGFEQWEVDGEMGISEKVGSWWSWERQTAASLHASLSLSAQEELKGELYCVQETDSSCILRQLLQDGNTIKSISIESMPDKKRAEFWPAVNLQALERRA